MKFSQQKSVTTNIKVVTAYYTEHPITVCQTNDTSSLFMGYNSKKFKECPLLILLLQKVNTLDETISAHKQ